MENLIADSKLLTHIKETDGEDSAKEFLDYLIPNTFLLLKLYNKDYDFKANDLLVLLEQLNMLECSKIDEIIILLHFFDRKEIKNENINGDIIYHYLNLKIKESSPDKEYNLFDTLIYNDMLDLLQWIYHINWINEEMVFEKAIEYDSIKIFDWLLPKMNLSWDNILIKSIKYDSLNIFKNAVEIVKPSASNFIEYLSGNKAHKILCVLFRNSDKTKEDILIIYERLAINTGNLELLKIIYNEFNFVDLDFFEISFHKMVKFEIDIFEWFISTTKPNIVKINLYMDECIFHGYFEFCKSLFEYKDRTFGKTTPFIN